MKPPDPTLCTGGPLGSGCGRPATATCTDAHGLRWPACGDPRHREAECAGGATTQPLATGRCPGSPRARRLEGLCRELVGQTVVLLRAVETRGGDRFEAGAVLRVEGTHRGRFTLALPKDPKRSVRQVSRSAFRPIAPTNHLPVASPLGLRPPVLWILRCVCGDRAVAACEDDAAHFARHAAACGHTIADARAYTAATSGFAVERQMDEWIQGIAPFPGGRPVVHAALSPYPASPLATMACGLFRGVPAQWPPGHTWARAGGPIVNCAGCLVSPDHAADLRKSAGAPPPPGPR